MKKKQVQQWPADQLCGNNMGVNIKLHIQEYGCFLLSSLPDSSRFFI